MSATAIERVKQQAERVAAGQPVDVSNALRADEAVRQGDVYFRLVDAVPDGYRLCVKPTDADRQLAIGASKGSRHIIESLDGVELYHPDGWGPDYDALLGPALVLSKPCVVGHPEHGAIRLPADCIVQVGFGRELDAELRRERRLRD